MAAPEEEPEEAHLLHLGAPDDSGEPLHEPRRALLLQALHQDEEGPSPPGRQVNVSENESESVGAAGGTFSCMVAVALLLVLYLALVYVAC